MASAVAESLKTIEIHYRGRLFIGVFEVNPKENADSYFGWQSIRGHYIGQFVGGGDLHQGDEPTFFSCCLGWESGDILFRNDGSDVERLKALASKLAHEMGSMAAVPTIQQTAEKP